MAPGFTPPRLLRHADVQAALANSGWRRKLVLGEADSLLAAYDRAYLTDIESAFGGIIAFNRELDAATANAVVERQFVRLHRLLCG